MRADETDVLSSTFTVETEIDLNNSSLYNASCQYCIKPDSLKKYKLNNILFFIFNGIHIPSEYSSFCLYNCFVIHLFL
jgi:hypothetical protein